MAYKRPYACASKSRPKPVIDLDVMVMMVDVLAVMFGASGSLRWSLVQPRPSEVPRALSHSKLLSSKLFLQYSFTLLIWMRH